MSTSIASLLGNNPVALNAKHKASPEEIKQAGIEFESMFLSEMMKPMFEDLGETDPMFGGGFEEEIYRSFMTDEMADQTARSGGIGIASYVQKELLKLSEVE